MLRRSSLVVLHYHAFYFTARRRRASLSPRVPPFDFAHASVSPGERHYADAPRRALQYTRRLLIYLFSFLHTRRITTHAGGRRLFVSRPGPMRTAEYFIRRDGRADDECHHWPRAHDDAVLSWPHAAARAMKTLRRPHDASRIG